MLLFYHLFLLFLSLSLIYFLSHEEGNNKKYTMIIILIAILFMLLLYLIFTVHPFTPPLMRWIEYIRIADSIIIITVQEGYKMIYEKKNSPFSLHSSEDIFLHSYIRKLSIYSLRIFTTSSL